MRVYYSDDHRLRNAKTEIHQGELVTPFECPERADIILARTQIVGLGDVVAPEAFGLAPVLKVHDADFVDFLASCWKDWAAQIGVGEAVPTVWPSRSMPSPHVPDFIEGKIGYYALAAETSISEGTWEAALASKDVALSGIKHVLGGASSAFSLCRPPGHHAAKNQFGGYCFLNNAAIAAQYARDNGAEKVAVLDVDFHHGNGTQDIFYDRGDVLFASLHGDPKTAFPHFLGYAEETGRGAGAGTNFNYPMPTGTTYAVWAETLEQSLAEIKRFGAEVLVVSLGVDTFENDPISDFKLKSADFADYGRRIAKLAIPTLFVMEGGYAVEEIGVNAVNVLQGFE